MTAGDAPRHCTKKTVVPRIMSSDTTRYGAFDTAFGLGRHERSLSIPGPCHLFRACRRTIFGARSSGDGRDRVAKSSRPPCWPRPGTILQGWAFVQCRPTERPSHPSLRPATDLLVDMPSPSHSARNAIFSSTCKVCCCTRSFIPLAFRIALATSGCWPRCSGAATAAHRHAGARAGRRPRGRRARAPAVLGVRVADKISRAA